MASHVVVIDSSARRTTVKTTPNKYLSDVLDEACTKLGISASQYGLKNNNKAVDLSRTIRLSGLSSGAKLELVQLSKSAGVVSVALQLPESEGGRLTDKFPSTTTLWLILRKFEAGVAGGGGVQRNLTARGSPSMSAGDSGAGKLYYQTPVLHLLSRELFSFTDLQKSLAQLGLNSGTVLIRLSFRTSETPLEEAMEQIEGYFKSVDASASTTPPALATSSASLQPTPDPTEEVSKPVPEWTAEENIPQNQPQTEILAVGSSPPSSPTTRAGRPISVFAPPTSSTPLAAQGSFNPNDYVPTVQHAQTHQKMLSQSSRNTRLPTEAEIAAQTEAEKEKLASIKDVEVRVRFPDECSISSKFGQSDSGAALHAFVRECLDEQWQGQNFVLRVPGVRGKSEGVVPDVEEKLLIKDLGLKGRLLVVFSWDESASPEARRTKEVLKLDLRKNAKPIEIKGPVADDDPEEQGTRVNVSKPEPEGEKKKGGVPKWLKLGKK